MRKFIRWCHFIGYALAAVTVLLEGIGVTSLLFLIEEVGELGILTGGFYIVFAFLSVLLAVLKFKHIKGSVACGVTCAVFEFLVGIPTILLAVMSLINSGDLTYLGDAISSVIGLIIVIYAIPV